MTRCWPTMTRDERIAAIRAGVADGMTAAAIAAVLGAASRNVIIGFAGRNSVALRSPSKAAVANWALRRGVRAARPRPATKPAPRLAQPRAPKMPRLSPEPIRARPEPTLAPAGVPVPFPRASIFACPWIDGDPRATPLLCCGQPVTRGAYCGFHSRIAYQPRSDRERATG